MFSCLDPHSQKSDYLLGVDPMDTVASLFMSSVRLIFFRTGFNIVPTQVIQYHTEKEKVT